MRIAQIAPIVERVPPKKYGGTERVIYSLTEELIRMGHEVTLFASGDSKTSARLISVVDKPLRELSDKADIYGMNLQSMINVGLAYSMQGEFDVIHDHNPNLGLPTANIAKVPVVTTWHGPFGPQIIEYFTVLNKPNLVSISHSQAALAPQIKFAGNVYNGLEMQHYPFSATHENYLLFVGRIDIEKGLHHAMDAAVRLGTKLIIAAKLDDNVPAIKYYFQKHIRPRLRNHPQILQWIGEVDEQQRNELMKNAACLLHPVTWPEPFGLVLIEAMACGCPVVGFAKGSIPEIVISGKTGFVVTSVSEMVSAVKKIDEIDRGYCRQYALANFSARNMALGYEAIYEKVAKQHERQKLFLGYGS